MGITTSGRSKKKTVTANLKWPKADGIAWPGVAGYNGHIMEKGKDASCDYTANKKQAKRRPNQRMVIISCYELKENREKGVFC